MKLTVKGRSASNNSPLLRGKLISLAIVCKPCGKLMQTVEVDVETWASTGHTKYHECKECFKEGLGK